MFQWLKPAPHIAPIPENLVKGRYKSARWQVFIGIFVGYAAYYLIRKNFGLAIPFLEKEGYSKTELGFAASMISISYGFSKFIMGSVSDRSNAKYFLPLGLIASCFITFLLGFSAFATSSILIMSILLFLNGWFQGMGWPPCGRSMVHWFAASERGKIVSIWNIAHNVGAGLMANLAIWGYGIYNDDWHAYFYVPAGVATGIAVFVFFIMKDTPQSIGLPPIEKFKNEYPKGYSDKNEKELSTKELFAKYIIKNKVLWYIAFANACVYFIRYGVLDWAPSYMQQVKHYSIARSGWLYAIYEYIAIPGTLICGWLSDSIFKNNRANTAIVFLALTLLCTAVYWLSPINSVLVDSLSMVLVGFFIYGPVMLIGLHALELVNKKAAGTAAGFTGLFGYLGGALMADLFAGGIIDYFGWDVYFICMIASGILAIILLRISDISEKHTE